MLELPEALARAKELNDALASKVVAGVLPPTSPHKFCWFSFPAEEYGERLRGRAFRSAEGFGIFVEMDFDGAFLCVNDGVGLRMLAANERRPAKHQLLIEFTDGTALAFSVTMYGGIYLHDGQWDNEYYRASRDGVSPLSEAFTEAHLESLIRASKPTQSVKALLATQQRIPGLGNGALQDVLFNARIHPKRKISTLTDGEIHTLHAGIRATLTAMAAAGGRDTERDLFGRPGGYRTLMGRNALASGCPACGGAVSKENYLGGAIYTCAVCQPLTK